MSKKGGSRKRGLNRSIQQVRWYKIVQKILRYIEKLDGIFTKIHALCQVKNVLHVYIHKKITV